MTMKQSVLSTQTQDLYKNLQQNQDAITKQLSKPAEGDTSGTKTYASLTQDVNDRISELEKGIQTERQKLDDHEKNIETSVKAKILD